MSPRRLRTDVRTGAAYGAKMRALLEVLAQRRLPITTSALATRLAVDINVGGNFVRYAARQGYVVAAGLAERPLHNAGRGRAPALWRITPHGRQRLLQLANEGVPAFPENVAPRASRPRQTAAQMPAHKPWPLIAFPIYAACSLRAAEPTA